MKKKVGIIIVGFKDYVRRYLLECRDSLQSQNYPKDLYQVYIIDNCSLDNCQFIKNNYPEARFTSRLDGNYTAANNLGIKMAREDGCEYFVFTNMDTKFHKNWLSELIKAVVNNFQVGIVQSKILLYSENKNIQKINSLGNIIHFLGFGFTNGYNQLNREIKGYPEIKGYASGSSFLIKKEVLDIIGNYDEEYWMYHDDMEISWRTKLAGYKIILAPQSVIYHKYEFSRSVQMLFYMERNRYLVMYHYYKLLTIIFLSPAILVMEIGMIFYSLINGWFFDNKLKIIFYFFQPKTWQKIRKKRKQIKKIRKIADKKIVKNFSGKILFQEIANPVLDYIANPVLDFYWQIIKKIIIW